MWKTANSSHAGCFLALGQKFKCFNTSAYAIPLPEDHFIVSFCRLKFRTQNGIFEIQLYCIPYSCETRKHGVMSSKPTLITHHCIIYWNVISNDCFLAPVQRVCLHMNLLMRLFLSADYNRQPSWTLLDRKIICLNITCNQIMEHAVCKIQNILLTFADLLKEYTSSGESDTRIHVIEIWTQSTRSESMNEIRNSFFTICECKIKLKPSRLNSTDIY